MIGKGVAQLFKRYANALFLVFLLALFSLSMQIQAEQTFSLTDLESMSLDELLNVPVSVASIAPSTLRDSPGIISVLTAQEIRALGARDIKDVLRLVPGLFFGQDVAANIGFGIRGNWGYEGKVLVLVDDQIWNDPSFGTVELNGAIPIEFIQKIEIIRGPGSVLYGSYAELGVIKITTRYSEQDQGMAFVAHGQMQHHAQRNRLGYGFAVGEKVQLTVEASASQGQRTDFDEKNLAGGIWSGQNTSPQQEQFLNSTFHYGNFALRVMHDHDHHAYYDEYESEPGAPFGQTEFDKWWYELKYSQQLSQTTSVDYQLRYRRFVPWIFDTTVTPTGDFRPQETYNQDVRMWNEAITLQAKPSSKFSLVSGLESETGTDKNTANTAINWKAPENSYDTRNNTFFLQTEYQFKPVNLVAGWRFEEHSRFGNFSVPRIGVTKKYDQFNVKFFASNAFRNPSFQNFMLNEAIKRETTRVYELEMGYQLNSTQFLTANVYDIHIKNPIIFSAQNDAFGHYENFSDSGTKGVELTYTWRKSNVGFFNLSYSYYTASHLQTPEYVVQQDSHALLGAPRQKIVAAGSWDVSPQLTLGGSILYESKKYSKQFAASQDENQINVSSLNGVALVNVSAQWHVPYYKGLDAEFSLFNVTNQPYYFVQPYAEGQSAPLVDASRELFIRASYAW